MQLSAYSFEEIAEKKLINIIKLRLNNKLCNSMLFTVVILNLPQLYFFQVPSTSFLFSSFEKNKINFYLQKTDWTMISVNSLKKVNSPPVFVNCPKRSGSRVIVDFVGLLPSCYRAFVTPKCFIVGIPQVQIFSHVPFVDSVAFLSHWEL